MKKAPGPYPEAVTRIRLSRPISRGCSGRMTTGERVTVERTTNDDFIISRLAGNDNPDDIF